MHTRTSSPSFFIRLFLSQHARVILLIGLHKINFNVHEAAASRITLRVSLSLTLFIAVLSFILVSATRVFFAATSFVTLLLMTSAVDALQNSDADLADISNRCGLRFRRSLWAKGAITIALVNKSAQFSFPRHCNLTLSNVQVETRGYCQLLVTILFPGISGQQEILTASLKDCGARSCFGNFRLKNMNLGQGGGSTVTLTLGGAGCHLAGNRSNLFFEGEQDGYYSNFA